MRSFCVCTTLFCSVPPGRSENVSNLGQLENMVNKNWNALSDKELRQELCSRGYPQIPITETTRGIIIKKLQSTTRKINEQKLREHGDTNLNCQDTYGDMPALSANRHLERTSLYDRKDLGHQSGYMPTTGSYSGNYQAMYSPPPYQFCNMEDSSNYRFNDNFIPINRKQASSNYLPRTDRQSHNGVVNRLLSFREKAFSNQKILYNDNNQAQLLLNKKSNQRVDKYRRKFINIVKYIGAQATFNQSFVPYLLVSAFVAFFVLLSIMYMFRSPDIFEISESSSYMPICNDSVQTSFCIRSEHVSSVINLLKVLMKLIKDHSSKYYCSKNHIGITESELIEYMHKNSFAYSLEEMQKMLLYVTVLVQNNPQWNIRLQKFNSLSAVSSKDVPEESTLYFLITSHASIICVIYKKIQKCFAIIGIGAIIAVILTLSYATYRYIRAWQLNRSNIVEQFTTDIVNELIYRASLNETPEEREVVINHLRDKLIPLNKRFAYMGFWNEALRILQANDSRIQFGVTLCNGEECRTMKWIGNTKTNVNQSGTIKKWQSPAFDSSNKIANPPTPCLKIRHMFDPSEVNHPDLKQIIETAILEKVGSRCGIYDIQIDKQSCCIYLRCASEIDAGIIHNEINGWWFDKRLISIKFLRLQRYLARFPNTVMSK